MAESGQEQNCDGAKPEEHEMRVGYYVVLLIDVLGQKTELVEWANQARACKGQLSEGLIESLQNTAGVVTKVREMGIDFFEQANTDYVPEYFASLPQEQKEVWSRCTGGEIKTQCFSDTCVFYAPIGNGHGDIDTRRVFTTIIGACSLMLSTLARKNPVRGSVCVEHGIELAEGDFYGPALNLAHRLEEKKAEHPRILVDGTVTNLLTQCKRYSPDDFVDRMMKRYAKEACSLITRDVDGKRRMVDYAGAAFRDFYPDSDKLNLPAFEAAYEFVCAEKKRFQDHEILGPRYALVEEYLTERLPLWRGDVAEA